MGIESTVYSGETFAGENYCKFGENMIFVEKNFHGLVAGATKDVTPQMKTFTNIHKTLKFAQVFLPRKFPAIR